jgi:hypothetical protein
VIADDLPQQTSRWRRWGGVTISTLVGAAVALSAWYIILG